jgi:hypothetical protein
MNEMSTPSPNDDITLPGFGPLTDSSGNTYTITSAGTVDMNGAPLGYTANVIELAYVNGNIWQENNSGLWWEYTGNPSAPWTGLGTGTSPVPAEIASPNDSVIMPGTNGVYDNNWDEYTITTAGTVDMQPEYGAASPLGYTANVVEGAFVNGQFWQASSSGLWWKYTGNPSAPWTGLGTPTSPLPVSPNDATIAAGYGAITDSAGNTFAITSSGTVYMDGSSLGYTANVAGGAFVDGHFWQENSAGLWWEYTGNPSAPWTGLGSSTSPLPNTLPLNNDVVSLYNATETFQLGSGYSSGGQINLNGNADVTKPRRWRKLCVYRHQRGRKRQLRGQPHWRRRPRERQLLYRVRCDPSL